MPRERLSGLDTSFLYLETRNTPMHIASLAVYERGPAPVEELRQMFERRLHLVPRFRQRLASVPAGLHRPVWVDDPEFDLETHVRHMALPKPGNDEQLKQLCGHLLSLPLDRSRPLWEMYLIDGLSGDRFAVLSKTHHCVWDGVTGADVHAVLLDTEPDPPLEAEAGAWTPRPQPTVAGLVVDATRDRVGEALNAAGTALNAVRHPKRAAKEALGLARGASALAGSTLRPAPRSPLNVRIGGQRRYGWAQSSLAEAKRIGRAFGATVNDVVLATVGGALCRWMERRGLTPQELEVMVPVSIRSDDDASAGNRVAMLVVPLPCDERDPAARLQKVSEHMRREKASGAVRAGEVVTRLSDVVPPVVVAQMTRLQEVGRAFNLLVTNVPGPQMPLYLCGRRLLDLFPQAPLAANQALAVGVLSYNGTLGFGLLGEREAMYDLDVLEDGIEASMSELGEAAGPQAAIVQRERAREGLVPVS